MIWTLLILIIGFIILLKGGDLLVDGAVSLARRLCVSPLIIGLTIVAFGTSAPELVVNIYSSFRGAVEIAIGNVVGSNIFNIAFILGLSVLIRPLFIRSSTITKEIPFMLLATVVMFVLVLDKVLQNISFNFLSRADGLIFLAFFSIFLIYVLSSAFEEHKNSPAKQYAKHEHRHTWPAETRPRGWGHIISFVILGLTGLYFGSRLVVDSAVEIAQIFGLSEALIGLTIVAIGTSLPEIVTSAMAAWKKEYDVAVGNIVGSNIFNSFFILGVSATIRPLPFQDKLLFDIVFMIIISALLFIFSLTGRRLVRSEGIIFLLLISFYFTYIIFRG